MKTETSVTLSRLNCNGCVRNVTKALQTLPEVELMQTDIPTKTVHLRYPNNQTALEQIKTVLLEAGYPVVAEQPAPQDQLDYVETPCRRSRPRVSVGIVTIMSIARLGVA